MPAAHTPRSRVGFTRATSAFTYIVWAHRPSSQIPSVAPNTHLDGKVSEREYSMSQALVIRPPADGCVVQFLRLGKSIAQPSFQNIHCLQSQTAYTIASEIWCSDSAFPTCTIAVLFSFSKRAPMRSTKSPQLIHGTHWLNVQFK
ncbi:hypothetical protein C8R45DRAFT_1103460 [Mycena sanguinolenta]|nr:hypothetical protein C8R45DRAFT_1103460 [Mycena sanguinolenta]